MSDPLFVMQFMHIHHSEAVVHLHECHDSFTCPKAWMMPATIDAPDITAITTDRSLVIEIVAAVQWQYG